jgi:hypothetical protein
MAHFRLYDYVSGVPLSAHYIGLPPSVSAAFQFSLKHHRQRRFFTCQRISAFNVSGLPLRVHYSGLQLSVRSAALRRLSASCATISGAPLAFLQSRSTLHSARMAAHVLVFFIE